MRRPSPVLAAQFDICELAGRSTSDKRPPVVVLQHDETSMLATVIVAPLLREVQGERRAQIHPAVAWEGEEMFLFVERMAAIQRAEIKSVVGSAAEYAWQIKRAIDVVFFGF